MRSTVIYFPSQVTLSGKNPLTKDDVEEFIRRLKQYADAPELTREMCVDLIEYIVVGDRPADKSMPSVSIEDKIIGATIHNTDRISVASVTTPAEQYTKKMLTPEFRYFILFLRQISLPYSSNRKRHFLKSADNTLFSERKNASF